MVNYQFNGPVEESKTGKNWAQSQATTVGFATHVFELQARIASTRFNYEDCNCESHIISYLNSESLEITYITAKKKGLLPWSAI
jgi:hypothetical protein